MVTQPRICLKPLSWKAFNLVLLALLSCRVLSPYVSLDLITAFHTCSFLFFEHLPSFQYLSILFHVAMLCLIRSCTSMLGADRSCSRTPRYFALETQFMFFPSGVRMASFVFIPICSHFLTLRYWPYVPASCSKMFSCSSTSFALCPIGLCRPRIVFR